MLTPRHARFSLSFFTGMNSPSKCADKVLSVIKGGFFFLFFFFCYDVPPYCRVAYRFYMLVYITLIGQWVNCILRY
ncbi:hypothetical protein F5X97DRAFT_144798 [Nemania serpens]|nr:hypothetical protein F5X97DRAFT_144798 [Nemania serpens]